MVENVDGLTDDGWRTDTGVTGILIAHLGAFDSGELINIGPDLDPSCKKLLCLSSKNFQEKNCRQKSKNAKSPSMQ